VQDLPSSYLKTHPVPSHYPPKRQPRVPGAVLLSQASYTYTPALVAAPHFNSRGELIPLTDVSRNPLFLVPDIFPYHTPQHISASISRNSAQKLSPCTRCRVVLPPGHLSSVCNSCHAGLYIRPPQSSSMAQLPFSIPSQPRKQPIEQGNTPPPDLRSSVEVETPRHDASTAHPVCVPPPIPKCSDEHMKPVLDTNFVSSGFLIHCSTNSNYL
jgi:hypothetical protein